MSLKNMFESASTQMKLLCNDEKLKDEMIMKNMFESVSTQMKLECNDEKLEKYKCEFVLNQTMMVCGVEIFFQ